MRCAVNFLYFAGRQMGIYLGRRKRLVAEHLLNASEIRATVEHMGGEAASQRMRADPTGLRPAIFEVFIHFPGANFGCLAVGRAY